MLFNSWLFWCFFAVVYTAYLLIPRWRLQNLTLLAASYLFYASWNWKCLGLILASTLVDYLLGLAIANSPSRTRRRIMLITSMTFNLALLAIFKYYGFFVENLEHLAQFVGVSPGSLRLEIILPVGISFYTFQTMSYTIDIYRGELKPTRDPLNFALFVAFFPQLVAGPIERAKVLLPQIERPRELTAEKLSTGSWLVFWGLWKKIVVADNLALIVDPIFDASGSVNAATAYLGVFAFAFQIYCDFSGYTDIARGVARLLGLELMRNFNMPYIALDPSEFWRRWHISLSSWLRDYLYIPLGGNRGPAWFVYRNLMITMVLGGLWHGASWNFVWWGVFHGLLLCGHRLLQLRNPGIRAVGVSTILLQWFFMFHATLFGWLLFRCTRRVVANGISRDDSWQQMTEMMTAWSNGLGLDTFSAELLARISMFIAPLLIVEFVQIRAGTQYVLLNWPLPVRALGYALLTLVWLTLGVQTGSAFIYFQF